MWDGLKDYSGKPLCNGLLADWAGWQKENGEVFQVLCSILKALSPEDEILEPGALTRISVNDPRNIPTIKMNYGLEVPLPKASAGMRRIVAMAYMLVWTWREQYQASKFLGRPAVESVTFLVDEIEAHLHPKWQRLIVGALLNVNSTVSIWPDVQLIVSTHSPMVMASLEEFFDRENDSWFDLDYVESEQASREQIVSISKRPFLKQGDASNWPVNE